MFAHRYRSCEKSTAEREWKTQATSHTLVENKEVLVENVSNSATLFCSLKRKVHIADGASVIGDLESLRVLLKCNWAVYDECHDINKRSLPSVSCSLQVLVVCVVQR